MCINCNLVAPLQHDVCELLGIPRNVYGVVSNTFDVLENLLVDISLSLKYNDISSITDYAPNKRDASIHMLFQFLVEHKLFHHIETLLKNTERYSSVVDRSFVNYVLVKYFEIDWTNDYSMVDSFAVPVDLLATDPKRLRACIGKTSYKQIELIPQDIIQKYKITNDKAIEYDIQLLPDQQFYNLDIN